MRDMVSHVPREGCFESEGRGEGWGAPTNLANSIYSPHPSHPLSPPHLSHDCPTTTCRPLHISPFLLAREMLHEWLHLRTNFSASPANPTPTATCAPLLGSAEPPERVSLSSNTSIFDARCWFLANGAYQPQRCMMFSRWAEKFLWTGREEKRR